MQSGPDETRIGTLADPNSGRFSDGPWEPVHVSSEMEKGRFSALGRNPDRHGHAGDYPFGAHRTNHGRRAADRLHPRGGRLVRAGGILAHGRHRLDIPPPPQPGMGPLGPSRRGVGLACRHTDVDYRIDLGPRRMEHLVVVGPQAHRHVCPLGDQLRLPGRSQRAGGSSSPCPGSEPCWPSSAPSIFPWW